MGQMEMMGANGTGCNWKLNGIAETDGIWSFLVALGQGDKGGYRYRSD